MIVERVVDIGAAPAEAGIGDLEIAARRRAPAAHADAGGPHVEEAAGLVLASSTPVMWSSTTITSSTWPSHCWAKMPMVAEPQPTRMRSSASPLMTGALAGLHGESAPPSIVELDRALVAKVEHASRR